MFDRLAVCACEEAEIKLREELASGSRQFRSDRLCLFEFRNVMTAEASVPGDESFADVQVLLVDGHALQFFSSLNVRGVVSQEFESDAVQCRGIGRRDRLLLEFRI